MTRYMISLYSVAALLIIPACNQKDTINIQLKPELCLAQGRMVPNGELATPRDLALDTYCAALIVQRNAPNGVITIFGSSRAKEGMESYDITRRFASIWTKDLGDKYPILTGGGPGIMEAGNRGAKEAGGKSLSFATYFGSGAEKTNSYITDGYLFASFSQREAEMVDRAAAVVIAPGGVGTEWEIFETLSKLQTKKKKSCPVILLGKKNVWTTLISRLNYLKSIKTISPETLDLLQVAETPEKAVEILKIHLK